MTNSHIPPDYNPQKDKIEIVPYDPNWPGFFLKEEEVLRRVLGRFPGFKIEHIGSTSVPGLAAKPIIDIAVCVDSKKYWPVMAKETKRLDYLCWGDNEENMVLIKLKDAKRVCHLHIFDSQALLAKVLAFRDHLRANPDDAKKYETLKRELAAKYANNREAYTEAKADFILDVLKKINVG